MIKRSLIALILTLGMSACGGITEGTVYEKTYSPAKDWTTTEPDYDTRCLTRTRTAYVNGKSQQQTYQDCKRVFDGYEEVAHHEDECYRVAFRKDDDTGSDCVAQDVYDSLEVGDYYRG